MGFNIYAESEHKELPKIDRNPHINDPTLYRPSEGLIGALNVALNLNQPLLLTGEPGTGKTQLAHHIAHYFNLGKPLVFNAQTTSVAKDLFYQYDALGHFQYSQANNKTLTPEDIEKEYIKYNGLGKAIKEKSKFVVLLDEIDKAPRDLPNDILAALENLRFDVPEIRKQYKTEPEHSPIIIMTSNSEKNLPDAFLRRVIYYHIPFPKREMLLKILQSKTDGFSEEQLDAIIDHFEIIRNSMVKLSKPPATAELLYWTNLLKSMNFAPEKLNAPDKQDSVDKDKLIISYSVLAKTKEDLRALKRRVERN